jgi:hypothetical protein
MSSLKPFKVKPYIVWAFVIGLLLLVTFASTRSNYEPRGSVKESIYEAPSVLATGPIMGTLETSPNVVIPSQVPLDFPTPPVDAPPYLFPKPADSMAEYDHVNLTVQTMTWPAKNAVRMIPLNEADESMYPATLDELFAASEQDGFMQASVDTLYDVNALQPPRLMTDQVETQTSDE